MRGEVLPEPTKELFEQFGRTDLPRGTYLAGGTALALRLGHRQSVDLDWFTAQEFDEKVWQMKWEAKWGFKLLARDWQTLTGDIQGVKTALYYYKYPLLEKTDSYNHLPIAGLKDLAAMKLDAVLSRGTRRDFVDLYFLTKEFGPERMFAFYRQKYGDLADKGLMLRKALIYFGDADEDEMPRMLVPLDWEEVKAFFLKTFV